MLPTLLLFVASKGPGANGTLAMFLAVQKTSRRLSRLVCWMTLFVWPGRTTKFTYPSTGLLIVLHSFCVSPEDSPVLNSASTA